MDTTPGKRWPKVLLVLSGLFILVAVLGVELLDSFLLRTAREQAAPVARRLGRPIEIGGLSTTLLSGLGVRVTGVKLGPGPGESTPLLEIGRIEVKAALLQALFSGGKQVEVRSAVVEGLHVSVVKYQDQKTNLEHLQQAMAESPEAAKKEEPKPEGKPADLSFLRVDHLALAEGRIDFSDQSGPGSAPAKALAISHLALTVDDLRAGKPLQLLLSAAVLAETKNFELKVATAPLPATLQPVVKQLSLAIQPIDLAPLGPFTPASVGLLAGRLDADLQAALGAAVPGGEGPTSLKGSIRALGLRFAGAEEGKPLDLTLESDLTADLDQGDASLKLLELVAGPASLTGSGKASGVLGPAPRIEGLELVGHGLDPAALAAFYPPLRKQLNGMVAGPIGLSLRGSGSAGSQSLLLSIDLTPVRLEVPEAMTKAAGARMTFELSLRAAGAGKQAFEATADLAGVDLRPGASLAKAPGDPLQLSLGGHRSAAGSREAPQQHLELSTLALHLLDSTITGKASADLTSGKAPTTRFDLALHSQKIDLDRLLIKSDKKKPEKPPLDPKVFAGLSGNVDVRIAELVLQKQPLTDLVAVVELHEDEVLLRSADLHALGGAVSAAGSRLKLAHPKEPFTAKLQLTGIDLDQAARMGTEKKVLTGRLDALVDLTGGGQEKELLQKTLAGVVSGKVLDGVFYGKDLVASASGPLAKALPFGLAGKDGSGGQTSLGKELPFALQIKDGQATMTKPLVIERPEGKVTLTGGTIGLLDGLLNLPGTVELSPATISAITGGRAKVNEPVPVKVRVTGPATSPSVGEVDFGGAAAAIGKAAASQLIGGSVGGAVGDALGGLLGGGKDAAPGAGKGAPPSPAPQPEDAAKKKLEEEAKKRLKGLFGN